MFFIIIGTGRCGTVSIAHILNQCNNVIAQHETSEFLLHWYSKNITKTKQFNDLIQYFTEDDQNKKEKEDKKYKQQIKSEVGFFYLPHWKEIQQYIPEVKFVCLHRPKEEFISSILKKTLVYMEEFSDHPFYLQHCLPYEKRNPKIYTEWFDLLPKFQDANTVEESWSMYWDMYEIESKNIPNCFHLNMVDLNDDEKLTELFVFLEIPEENWNFTNNRKFNEST